MKHPDWNTKLAVITGASSGIGAAIAREFAGHGIRVILVARRKEWLERIALEIRQSGGQADSIVADLSQRENCLNLYQQITDNFGQIDILVNNAGVGWYGYYSDMSLDAVQELLQINVASVTTLTRLFLPSMQSLRSGHIINIGSIVGSIPSQGVAMYSASKAFLDAFTTAIYRELHGSGVSISVVRAGPVTSEFFQRVENQPGSSAIPVEQFAISADVVARKIFKLLQHPRRVIYVPGFLRITPWIEQLFGWLEDCIGPMLLKHRGMTAGKLKMVNGKLSHISKTPAQRRTITCKS